MTTYLISNDAALAEGTEDPTINPEGTEDPTINPRDEEIGIYTVLFEQAGLKLPPLTLYFVRC